jgi:hypothetical protein
VVNFLWSEIDGFCRRSLHQVHRLALAYGWTEAQILSLSPTRRGYYLGLVQNG